MLTTDQINDLHRLYWSERWPIRKIERHLRMSWRTIKKYLDAPAQAPAQRQRESKLDPVKTTIAERHGCSPAILSLRSVQGELSPEAGHHRRPRFLSACDPGNSRSE